MKGRPPTTCVVLTVRTESTRYANKALIEVAGKPLLEWLTARLGEIGNLVMAVPEGDALALWGKERGFQVFEGSMNDVTGRIWGAVQEYYPNAQFVMRGLGDCPFVSPDIAKRSVQVMKDHDAETFMWALPPFEYTVYGASEFPRAMSVWKQTNEKGVRDEREHPDLYWHRHRDLFKLVYHEPPAAKYLRPYRLEVDWKEDVELVQRLGQAFGRLPTLEETLDYLETHDDARVNQYLVEKTGLHVSYMQKDRRMWWEHMTGKPIVLWNDQMLSLSTRGHPVYCKAGTCLLGYADGATLYTSSGEIWGQAMLKCACGAGRRWFSKH